MDTSARLLRLLSLLQARRHWTGAELAERLDVTTRTVRRDIERLRDLGYPVHASRGVPGYELGAGAALPPLLLDDEEAVAIAVGLRTAARGGITGIDESATRALVKLEQVLPSRLRHRVTALQTAVVAIPASGPTVDADVLTAVAAACRDAQRLRFDYRTRDGSAGLRTVEPHRLVQAGSRWYLLAWDVDRDDWRTFRVDRMRPRSPTGPRFPPRDPPDPDAATYVASRLSSSVWGPQARIVVHEPAASLRARLWPGWGEVVERDATSCVLTVRGPSVASLAIHVLLLDAEIEVDGPPELIEHLRLLRGRLDRAVVGGPGDRRT
jgi:predicted DNA-binding transcriptional regulator YafY